jgi:HAD superfamily hydrolase (TIGR01549 family)
MPRITVVAFDVGETLVDETRHWGEWADWLGVPRLTLFAALGIVIERRWDHRRLFDLVRPGIDVADETRRRQEAGWRYHIAPDDFYPDALACLAELHRRGVTVGVAGNQPEAAEAALHALRVPADFIASSARWGVEKPDPRFFARLAAEAAASPEAIAYVGDRIDNDVLPAVRAGMTAIFLRRGPWALSQSAWREAAQAPHTLTTLADLPDLMATF